MSTDPDIDVDDPEEGVLGQTLATIVPDFIRKRFALKFALVLIMMGLILAGIGFTATGTLADQVEEDARAEYEQLATQQATIVEKWVERNSVSVRLASQSTGLTAGSDQSTDLTLRRLWGTILGDAEGFYLVSYDGAEPAIIAQASSSSTEANQQIPLVDSAQSWVADVDVTTMDTSEVEMSDVYTRNGDAVVGFVSPIQDSPSRYLVIEYDATRLGSSIVGDRQDDTPANHFAQIINSSGTVQVDSRMATADDAGSAVGSPYGNSQTVTEAMESPGENAARTSGVRIVEDDTSVVGEPYAVGYASIEVEDEGIDRQWAVVTHAPTSDLFGFVQTISKWGQIVTILAALLIGGVGAILGYSTASSVDRLRRKAEEIEQGNLDVAIHTTRIDSIGRLYDGFANMRDSLREQITEAEQARKEAEVSRAEAMEMNQYLQEKAEEYSQTMEQCAAGDLTRRMDIDGENEAMDRIASEFNEMIDELEKTTGQLKSFADEVEEAGEIVQNSSDSVQEAAEHVAESVQRISDDAYEQQERLQEISEEIDAIAARLDEFAAAHPDVDFEDQLAQIDEVARTVAAVVDLAEETLEESESVAGAAEEQAAELNEVSQRAGDLIRYAGPLHEVLDRFKTESEHEFYFPTGPRDEADNGE